jgi:hypothetical protein
MPRPIATTISSRISGGKSPPREAIPTSSRPVLAGRSSTRA